MSHAQIASNVPILERLLDDVMDCVDLGNPRSRAIAIEANQRYIEYLDELRDVILSTCLDESVTIKIDGKSIRFETVNKLANFLAETME
jgi:hypothetical protein